MIVEIDEFDIVLGTDFYFENKVIHIPLTKDLVGTRFNSTIIQTNTQRAKGMKMMSAIQLKWGLAPGELTFISLFVIEDENMSELITIEIQPLLENTAT